VILVDARPVPAYVALGANLGDARRTVRQAVQDLGRLPQTRLVRVSSLYRTAPVDSSGPDYINAVAEVATSLTPHALLAELQRLELAAGRERPYLNAPRTLDLDILLYDDLTLDSPTLTIPHPRMATRAFVLVPLTEIAPQLLGAELLEAVRGQVIERLPED
jgi:2-amino-4-hydroxy-6-hydroxymethyldihydropteridine diphosphokinase